MPRSSRISAALAAGATALAAVAAAPALTTASLGADDPAPAPRVVVAPVDSGINPYHEFFDVETSAVTPDVLAEFGIDEDHIIDLGASYAEDVQAGRYDGITAREAYWFRGTNIIAQSNVSTTKVTSPGGNRPFLPNSSGDTHGTGVTGSVVRGNPEAIIYFVEGVSTFENDAFTHPAVDIVTTSYGFATALPLPLDGSYEGVVELGKMHAGATTNDPSLAMVDGTGGPWWVLGVAGFEEGDSEGKQILSGTFPDVVADFTQTLPYCDVCITGTKSVGGTSFATPYTAGVASKVLLDARRRAGHLGGITEQDGRMVMVGGDAPITTWDLRRAMELGAYVPGFAPSTANVFDIAAPVNPVLPATQVGWGVVTADPEHEVVKNATAYLVDGTQAAKPTGTCEFMTGIMASRYALWDANVLSGSFGETNALGGSDHVAC